MPVDLAFFADAGVVWTSRDRPALAGGDRRIVRSVGGALRVNLFGLLIELGDSPVRPRRPRPWQIGMRQGF